MIIENISGKTKKYSLKNIILLSNIIIILISSGSIGLFTYYNSNKSIEDLGSQLSREISHRVQDQVYTLLETPHLLNKLHSDAYKTGFLNPDDVESQEKYFWFQIQNFKQVSHTFFSNSFGDFVGSRILGPNSYGIMLGNESTDNNTNYHYYSTDKEGNRVNLELVRPKNDPRLRPWFTAAEREAKAVWSQVYTTIDSNSLGISASLPIYNSDRTLMGVVGSNYVFTALNEFLMKIEAGKTGEVFIIEKNGLIISTSTNKPNYRITDSTNERIFAEEHESDLIRKSFSYFENNNENINNLASGETLKIDFDHNKYFLQITPIYDEKGIDWLIFIILPFTDFTEKIDINNRNSILIIILSIVIAFAVGITNANRILLPIRKLNMLTKDIAKGHWENQLEIQRNDEIGELAFSFNIMVDFITNIIDSMPSVLIGINNKGYITLWNNSAVNLTGVKRNDAIEASFLDFFPQFTNEINNVISEHKLMHFQYKNEHMKKDRTKKIIQEISIYPIISRNFDGFVIRIDDITSKSNIQDIMIQNEKMLSLGGLAAGMAHEINNPLGGILQTVEVMSKRLQNTSLESNIKAAEKTGLSMKDLQSYISERDLPRMFKSINESGKRASSIIQNMLSFARDNDSDFSTQSLQDIIENSLKLSETDYNLKKQYDFRKIEIIKEYSEDVPSIICEENKIQQVIMNILRNGAQAMHRAEIRNPRLILRIKYIDNIVSLEIEDNGPGMDSDTQKRIFEPFFTTKPIGEGTGLGLSISFFIITNIHKGEIVVESKLGKGTKFIIRFPKKENILN
ncbi:MAG: HAMP domain-containing protein [Spirochaetaceae bacterium]|nr:HAMP domain-containing protein [Spirochaetaceae bacterium]